MADTRETNQRSSGTARPGQNAPEPQAPQGQAGARPKPPYDQGKISKPGLEEEMEVKPQWRAPHYKAAGKLEGKVALVTGGDSGIGRAVAYLYAREGADVAIVYLPQEQADAEEIRQAIQETGRKCLLIPGDLSDASFCRSCIDQTIKQLGKLDILVSNAAHQNRKNSLDEVSDEEWDKTLKTNIYAYFHLVKAAVPHMQPGSAIIATGSEVGLQGSPQLPDYGATKGAIHSFTKVLAQNLIDKGIRANVVAPGPVWTPLNPADKGASEDKVKEFGKQTPMERAAQPEEIAPAYVFLASDADSSFISGIVLEEMGGKTTAG
jgi:NAD(P)-dependent dehydrogenase (short-subunit alcohol dehydrogenase family)